MVHHHIIDDSLAPADMALAKCLAATSTAAGKAHQSSRSPLAQLDNKATHQHGRTRGGTGATSTSTRVALAARTACN